jgi:prepilin-type N-terminal cleavage/methylation domain-containing protein
MLSSKPKSAIYAYRRAGFTLVEVMVATALLGFSLVVMFGLHSQAVSSNKHARSLTDCTYLAQTQLEELISVPWTEASGRPSQLTDGDGGTGEWDPLYHPSTGSYPTAINSLGATSSAVGIAAPTYYLTWEVDTMDSTDDTWVRIRVRCTYDDSSVGISKGTTISGYRYRDEAA